MQTLFADAATGARSTALVSQGRIGALISALSRECTQRPPLWHESAAALLTQLLVAFARAAQEPRQPRTDPARRALAARMHDLRATVHRRLTHAWTVAEMAAAVNRALLASDQRRRKSLPSDPTSPTAKGIWNGS